MNESARTVAVVLHYAREAMTAACVASLERSTEPVRVLIVDNASPDGSGARVQARFPLHDFLQTGLNAGYAGGNNRGIDRALAERAERVLVLNDDAEVSADCIALLNAALDADPKAAAASPTMLHADPAGVIWWGGGAFDRLRVIGTHEDAGRANPPVVPDAVVRDAVVPDGGRKEPRAPRVVTSLCGCAILFRADALRSLGAFREDFGSYVEDLELSARYTRAGWRLLHVPSAIVIHKVPYPEPEAAAWKIRLRDRNRRRVAREHLGSAERMLFRAWFYPTRLLRLAQYLMRGDTERARAIIAGMRER